ncbi:neutral zinc metallopeptidase [Granulicoccus sp. GXG6511]|uniref:neutral zinc metallopeptidase n=1 Tax=Granulicoccus sp. GXG6511 TaxID=3381351 RepID=UPI003D7C52CF
MRLKSALALATASIAAFAGLGVSAQAVPAAPPAAQVRSIGGETSSTGYSYSVQEYLEFTIDELDQDWSEWFRQNGYSTPIVGYVIVEPGQPFQSRCTDEGGQPLLVTHNEPNAFYCSADPVVIDGVTHYGMIILPVTTMQQMWVGNVANKRSQIPGDFAAGIVVAHEFAHHIVDELGAATGVRPTGKNNELIADCMAGVWMRAADERGLLTDTDLQEASAALVAVADPHEGGGHGTAAERLAALRLGYAGNAQYAAATPAACFAAYGR